MEHSQGSTVDPTADIFEIEEIDALVVLCDSFWIHFIDTSAARASLVEGSSSVESRDYTVWMNLQYTVGSTESLASPTQLTDWAKEAVEGIPRRMFDRACAMGHGTDSLHATQ